jgi:hypothetical protein
MAKDFVFRIKPGDPLPSTVPGSYRLILDESNGSIKLLGSDGEITNPVPVISNLQAGDFLYSTNGTDVTNTSFTSVIESNYGTVEYTYVSERTIESVELRKLSTDPIKIIDRIANGFYVDVEKIVCELTIKDTPFEFTGSSATTLVFNGRASGAIGDIDISFLTSSENAFVVQTSGKIGNSGGTIPTLLSSDSWLELALSNSIILSNGDGSLLVKVFYKLREF